MTTKRWLGTAVAAADLWTVTLSGTVTSQTYAMTINGKSVTYTAGGSDTVAAILTALLSAWNSSSIAEIMELSANGLPSSGPYTSITLTGINAGVPSSISVSTTGTATFTIANTAPATGPNDFQNSHNWSGGVAPANSDHLVFDTGSVPCLYHLNTTLTGITLTIQSGYSGTIGLPAIHASATSTSTYSEYRPLALTLAGGTVVINSPGINRCNLAFGSHSANVRVLATGRRIESNVPVVLIIGGDSSSVLNLSSGDVGLAFYEGDAATFPVVNQSYISNQSSDTRLTCGSGAALTTVQKSGGILSVSSNVTTLTQGQKGGTTTISDGAISTLDVQGGVMIINTMGGIDTLHVANDGLVNFDGDPRGKTVTNPIQCYGEKWAVLDNQKVVNAGTLTLQLNRGVAMNAQHGVGSLVALT